MNSFSTIVTKIRHIVAALAAALYTANQIYPFIDASQLNSILAGLAMLGLYSKGKPVEEPKPKPVLMDTIA